MGLSLAAREMQIVGTRERRKERVREIETVSAAINLQFVQIMPQIAF